MTEIRDEIMQRLWRGLDPFAGFPRHIYQVDTQGWGSDHSYLVEAITRQDQLIVAEVGVWKGGSTIKMATTMRDRGINGVVISVDTWLGSSDHWANDEFFTELGWSHGYPSLQRKFMANIVEAELCDYVVPLPIDSLNAAAILRNLNIALDVIHIDAGHDLASVTSDLNAWWPNLRDGGLLIGDDYGGLWFGVNAAFEQFFADRLPLEHSFGKCRVIKNTAAAGMSSAG